MFMVLVKEKLRFKIFDKDKNRKKSDFKRFHDNHNK